jgi:hypothetical protein
MPKESLDATEYVLELEEFHYKRIFVEWEGSGSLEGKEVRI